MDRRRFLRAMGLAAVAPSSAWASLRAPSTGLRPPETRLHGKVRPRDLTDLHALVLGTVQDAGLPQVGCYSERCDRAREAERPRYVASLALVDPDAERYWLVDATPDITRQIDLIDRPAFRERAGRRRPFDGILLTHAHIGHYLGLALLGNEGLGIRATPVYCTAAMAAFLEANAPWSLLVDQGRILPTVLEPGRWHDVDGAFRVQPLAVPHRDEFADTVGFVFQGARSSLLYLPDINSWTAWERDVAEVAAGVDTALLDGSFYSLEELPGRSIEDVPHPLMPGTMDLLQGVVDRGDCRVLFTHLNNSNPALDEGGPQEAEVLRRGFEIAREGMRVEL